MTAARKKQRGGGSGGSRSTRGGACTREKEKRRREKMNDNVDSFKCTRIWVSVGVPVEGLGMLWGCWWKEGVAWALLEIQQMGGARREKRLPVEVWVWVRVGVPVERTRGMALLEVKHAGAHGGRNGCL